MRYFSVVLQHTQVVVHSMLSRFVKFTSMNHIFIRPSLPITTHGMRGYKRHKSDVGIATDSKLIYSGPFSPAVKAIKLVSLMSSMTALITSPFLLAFGKEEIPMLGKSMIVTITLLASWGTTGLLHLLSRAYIHKLYYNSKQEIFTAHTTTLFYRTRVSNIHAADIKQPSDGIGAFFTTFVANKRPFYLHQEIMREYSVELYMRLLGMSSAKIQNEKERMKEITNEEKSS